MQIFFKTVGVKDREKQHKVLGKIYTIYSHEFLALPTVLVVLFSCNTLVVAVITSGLDVQ